VTQQDWEGTAPDDSTGPSVLYYSVDGAVADIYRGELPDGWRFAALTDRDDEDEKRRKLAVADAVIHTDTPVTREQLEVADRLRFVHRQGVGVDTLDLEALRDHGVALAICPHGTSEAVAEHAVLLMLAAGRHLVRLHEEVTAGTWPKWDYRARSVSLAGSTVGIVGFGRIGQATAQRVLAFGSDVLVHRRDGGEVPGSWPAGRVRGCADLDEVFAMSDIVSLHCPLVPETKGMVDARRLSMMKPHALLVNTARGGLIVQEDLVEALRNGVIRAAGLDCLAVEPPPPDEPIFSLPNVVLTPHMAAGTHTTQLIKARAVFANIARAWAGDPIEDQVL
jgi:phosphoglycerate dehydrogenase-like enzyme